MNIGFRTLTPVFTGDASTNQSPRLLEKGLIGSLRFWSGALLRGYGHTIPGATRDHPEVEIRNPEELAAKVNNGLDPVSRVFGCTGWGRTFSMHPLNSPKPHYFGKRNKQLHLKTSDKTARKGWYLKPGFLVPWNNAVDFGIPIRHGAQPWREEAEGLLAAAWVLVSRISGIGAHQGWGYGQVRLTGKGLSEELSHFTPPLIKGNRNGVLPDLADFVFAEYQFQEPADDFYLQGLRGRKTLFKDESVWRWPKKAETPALLKQPVGLVLRYLLQGKDSGRFKNSEIAKWDRDELFFGGSKDGLPAGRFHASFPYKVDGNGKPAVNGEHLRFRMWTWLPKNLFGRQESNGRPAWFRAAKVLYDELMRNDLWTAVAGCAPPKPIYFWPLTASVKSSELRPISRILAPVETRAQTDLARSCIGTK